MGDRSLSLTSVRMALLATATLAGLLFLLHGPARVASANGVSDPHIASVTYGGTGCPLGSVGSSFASSRESFTLIMDSFVASSGIGVPATEARKSCQLTVNINSSEPRDVLFELKMRGYVSLPTGISGEQSASYYAGEEQFDQGSSGFDGPVDRDYLATDLVCVTLSQAGVTTIKVNEQVRLLGSLTATAQITMDSIDGRLLDDPCAPESIVTLSGVTDGEKYIYSQQPSPVCTTKHFGAPGINATLSIEGSAPGVITATCSGATNSAGDPVEPVSATYRVTCSHATTYEGLVLAKINGHSQGTRQARVYLSYREDDCSVWHILVAPVDPSQPAAAYMTTSYDWKAPLKTAVHTWTTKRTGQSLETGRIFLGGQLRAMDTTTQLQVKLTNGTNGLTLSLTGKAPNGVGSNKVAFEITSIGLGLTPVPDLLP